MIKPKLSLCAETILRDTQSNNISAVNILEEVSVAEFPIALSRLSALFMLERDDEDPEQVDAAIILTLDGEEVGRGALRGDFEGKYRTRLILVAQGFPITRAGVLTASVIIDGEALSSWDIPIKQASISQEEDS